MPSQRKRIGFLPSEEVHRIIDNICRANEYSQSKVTGLLVEEALRSRGVLSDSFSLKTSDKKDLINQTSEKEEFIENKDTSNNSDLYTVNKNIFRDNIKMMHDYIEFKYFKKVMNKNKNIFD